MQVLQDLISKAYSTKTQSSNNFNQVVLDLLKEKGRVSKIELVEINLKQRVADHFSAEYDESNKEHFEFVEKKLMTAKRQVDMCLSQSNNKAAFNYWAEQEDIEERIVWNKDKTAVRLKDQE